MLPDLETLVPLAVFVESGFVLGTAGTWLAVRKAGPGSAPAQWTKLAVYFLIVHACFALSFWRPALAVFFGLLAVLGGWEIARLKTRPTAKTVALALWLAGACGGVLFFLPRDPGWFLWVYAQVAVLDAYSQIVGRLFGRRKLAPAISPAKTWEGAAGGFFAALLAGGVLRGLPGLELAPALGLAVVLALASIAADLAAARYKRLGGVKDYGTLIPGHGGVVDRFNSLFGVTLILGPLFWFPG